MFQTPEKKVAIATELLKDNVSTPGKFLRACHDAGITYGNRDTQDELWEFKEYVLRYVPGSIHAFRESLLNELDTACLEVCSDAYSDRAVGLILEALIRDGNWKTAEALAKKRETYTDALACRANKKIREAVAGNQPIESMLFRLALHRVKLTHAGTFRYMSDVARKEALLQSRDLALSANMSDNREFMYWFNRYINTHIGLFGYNYAQTTAVKSHGVTHYRYRVGTWAAVADFLVENSVVKDLAGFWNHSFECLRDVNSYERLCFPGAGEFIVENTANWDVIGKLTPGFYRSYKEAKYRLAKT